MTGTWASGWATGDIVTAAEFKKSAGSVFDSTLGASAASIDVTGISATYANLMISVYVRGDVAATTTPLLMRFNGDSGANYDFQQLIGSTATASASETFASTSMQVGYCPGSTATANVFSGAEVFIPHYAGSSNNKSALSLSGLKFSAVSGGMNVIIIGCNWRSNAAINQITFLPTTGNFVSGSRVTVHALGA